MLIKSIRCQVAERKKEFFSKGQTQWEPLSHMKGFLGQLGGWCEKDSNLAWIIAFWENPSAYQQFMKEEHDRIFIDSGQGKTYDAISIDFFEVEYQPQQLASLVEKADVLEAELLDSTLRISRGNSNEETILTANASGMSGPPVNRLSDRIQVDEAWRVVRKD
ncbi:YdbC family protein [Bacillus sp. ISL-39]|uniref:YdbC family protein n=1 Tax=Bacillus sp. ISL-39 TaxID=2819124 RepID=UPI001BEBA2DB|nr:YdbC family protein [Bacillus sp. ISL-39]MBT2639837.1 YdbC family protein [Bacillus sp. ISL-39]